MFVMTPAEIHYIQLIKWQNNLFSFLTLNKEETEQKIFPSISKKMSLITSYMLQTFKSVFS